MHGSTHAIESGQHPCARQFLYVAWSSTPSHLLALHLQLVLLITVIWAGFRIRIAAIRGWLSPLLLVTAVLLLVLATVHGWLSRSSLLTSRVKAKHAATAAGYGLLAAVDILLVLLIPYFPTRWQHRKMERQSKEGKQPSNKA